MTDTVAANTTDDPDAVPATEVDPRDRSKAMAAAAEERRLAATTEIKDGDGRLKQNGVIVDNLKVDVADGRGTRTLFENLSFSCRPGTITALTGPSGCGKTTLLTCLAGVVKFQGGRAVVAGQERKPNSIATPKQLRQIGIMFQDYRLVRSLNVVDNVALPLTLDGVSWRSARGPARNLLEQLGLGGHLKNRPASLSGGEQQRVALARAMIGRPAVLLADEPSAHLDGKSATLLTSYLLGLAETGACIVVSTHDRRLLAACDQQIKL
jgi:putative ABC transport system ATP-binding protein